MSKITIHKPEDFEGMRKAGKLAASILDYLTPFVKVGVTTEELDKLAHDFTLEHGAIPAPLNYEGSNQYSTTGGGFPKSICTSVNEVVCHGIPNEYKLKNGDIVNIDVTVILDGWHGDTSRMFYAGDVKPFKRKLVDVTYEAMMAGINIVKPGVKVCDIGVAIENYVKKHGINYGVVRDFCGHGLGKTFHSEPNVLHYDVAKHEPERMRLQDVTLQEGMFFTIEPMINIGTHLTKMDKRDKQGWIALTKDKKDSAQFEHSIGVTKDGVEIFTLSPKGWTKPDYEA